MPLQAGNSRAVISANIAEMIRSGRPRNQAIAASLSNARRHPLAFGGAIRRDAGGLAGVASGSPEEAYFNANPDVMSAFQAGNLYSPGESASDFAQQHFQRFGENEGRGWSGIAGGTPEAGYLKNNPDVMRAFLSGQTYSPGESGTDFADQHFERFGDNEGRAWSNITLHPGGVTPPPPPAPNTSAFDSMTQLGGTPEWGYLQANPDVRAAFQAGQTYTPGESAKDFIDQHFQRFGQAEGRAGVGLPTTPPPASTPPAAPSPGAPPGPTQPALPHRYPWGGPWDASGMGGGWGGFGRSGGNGGGWGGFGQPMPPNISYASMLGGSGYGGFGMRPGSMPGQGSQFPFPQQGQQSQQGIQGLLASLYGGNPYGGNPYGGNPYGGNPYGGGLLTSLRPMTPFSRTNMPVGYGSAPPQSGGPPDTLHQLPGPSGSGSSLLAEAGYGRPPGYSGPLFASGGVARRADGGSNVAGTNEFMRSLRFAGDPGETSAASGLLHSAVAGRTDKLPLSVAAGSYVLPADFLSGIGQGNTLAGARMMDEMLRTGPWGERLHAAGAQLHAPRAPAPPPQGKEDSFASGGAPKGDEKVDVIAAGGEMILTPEQVKAIGHGSMEKGHEILDKLVLSVRKKHIKDLKGLPPPKDD